MDADLLRLSYLEDQLRDELELPGESDGHAAPTPCGRQTPLQEGLGPGLRLPHDEPGQPCPAWGRRGSSEREAALGLLLPHDPRRAVEPTHPSSLPSPVESGAWGSDGSGGAAGSDGGWPPGLLDPAAYDIPVAGNHLVLGYLRLFLGRGRPLFARWLARAGAAGPAIIDALEAYGLPRDLLYVPMIESGFLTTAVSPSLATGYWQFMQVAGRAYGLRIDGWVDERRDPRRSTDAAAHLLQDLYDLFGSWELALAAYNGGIGRVGRAIVRYNTNDFWTLARYTYLPRQTVHYVAKVMAAAIIDHHREQLGFGSVVADAPPQLVEIRPAPGLTLLSVARKLRLKEAQLAELNPWLLRRVVPRTGPLPRLVVPAWAPGLSGLRSAPLPEIPEAEGLPFATHTVQLGETLGDIARIYGVYPALLGQLNQVGSNDELLPGQQLLVPVSQRSGGAGQLQAAGGKRVVFVPPVAFSYPDREQVFFPVPRRTVSLEAVAATFGLPQQEILMWNDLDPTARLWPGMVLRLYLPRGAARPPARLLLASAVEEVVVDSQRFHAELRRGGGTQAQRLWRRGHGHRYHRVQAGETMEEIARRYGVTAEQLAQTNRLRADRLEAGFVLRIPR